MIVALSSLLNYQLNKFILNNFLLLKMSTRTFTTIQPMSQKYRQKPKDIISKLNSNISEVQAEVLQYNLRQQRLSEFIPKSLIGKQSTLKMLTEPKLQNILLEKGFYQNRQFEQFSQIQINQKSKSRLNRQNTFANNFLAKRTDILNQSEKPKIKRSTTFSIDEKIKKQNNYTFIQDHMRNESIAKIKVKPDVFSNSKISNWQVNTKSQSLYASGADSNLLFKSNLFKDRNRAATFNDSIIMPFAEQVQLNQQDSCQLQTSRDLLIKIAAKKRQLQKQWNKTQKYRARLGLDNSLQKDLKKFDNRFNKSSKIKGIIDKIRDRRPQTTMTNRKNYKIEKITQNESILIETN